MKAQEKETLKIGIEVMPQIESVSSLIGDKLLDCVAEIMNLHQELKNMVVEWNGMVSKREEAAKAADEYLRIGLHLSNTNDTRKYIVRGIECEMKELLKKRDHIQRVLETVLYPQK